MTKSVLFVCLGNICRSPTAEGVFRQFAQERGLINQLEIDSAGTSNWHIGKPPDRRAIEAAAERGLDISQLRGRQANGFDMAYYDYIIAMDQQNYADLTYLAGEVDAHKIHLFLDYANGAELSEVPDPYFGVAGGFPYVYELIEQAANGLLDEIERALR